MRKHLTKTRTSRPLQRLVLSPRARALAKQHGTPAEFAVACYEAVPAFVSMDEAAAAIAKYNREWDAAQNQIS